MVLRLKPEEFARKIDHTILRPNATKDEVRKACTDSINYGFATCVVPPCYVKLASELLKRSEVKPCTVVGFPLGFTDLEVKIKEIEKALSHGAREIDAVMNISAFKSKNYEYVKEEIVKLTEICHNSNAIIKIIIETNLLNEEEKIKAAEIVAECGADYVKTNTGFLGRGVTIHDVKVIKEVVKGRALIKAAGGIRFFEDALALIEAGADRIGTSSGVDIFLNYLRKFNR
ncbi:MAG: deoxyribose-phosphate aldolase [Thermofilum sp. ex4484_15]|nr:MAG: deoxyribose-phosphate aldolase [Thermofilum sp. ex4484_15]